MKRTLAIEDTQDTQDTQDTMYLITLLPLDIFKYMTGFLNHHDARSLDQTCKSLHKYVPHKCLPPFTRAISHRDRERLKNKELILSKSEGLILDDMYLDSELINLIRDCCPKLKYLFIKYSCKCDALTLNFQSLPCVGISIKINILAINCSLSIDNLSSTVENFTAYIFRTDPITFKPTTSVNQRPINLVINNLENLKSL
jgi:hypothetical protein